MVGTLNPGNGTGWVGRGRIYEGLKAGQNISVALDSRSYGGDRKQDIFGLGLRP